MRLARRSRETIRPRVLARNRRFQPGAPWPFEVVGAFGAIETVEGAAASDEVEADDVIGAVEVVECFDNRSMA